MSKKKANLAETLTICLYDNLGCEVGVIDRGSVLELVCRRGTKHVGPIAVSRESLVYYHCVDATLRGLVDHIIKRIGPKPKGQVCMNRKGLT